MKRPRPQLNPITLWLSANIILMWLWKKRAKQLTELGKDENFLHSIEKVEIVVAKVLSLLMLLVILLSIFNLMGVLWDTLFHPPEIEAFSKTLFKIFGLFLNVLIALEILENITAYLKKHVFQVELVIATSLIAIARKIIILDLEKTTGVDIIGLGVALLALAISYWIIRILNRKKQD